MIVEAGQVVRAEANAVWVQTVKQSTCGSCRARHGCGQKLLNQFGATTGEIRVHCDQALLTDLAEGDAVEIGITEGAVVSASLITYGLPILCLVFGAWLGAALNSNFLNALTALAGLFVGALIVRFLLSRYFKPRYFEPVVLRRLASEVAVFPQNVALNAVSKTP